MSKVVWAAVFLVAVLAVACGGGGNNADATTAPNTPSAVDDEAYLAIMCAGLDAFSDAVETATSVEALSAAVQSFIDELQAVSPPADVAEFHTAFTNYLIESLDDPTRPLVIEPPLPDQDVRDRLAEKERDVAACKNPTFFQSDE